MDDTESFENGYHFPPKYPWPEATRQFLVSFWKFFITIKGFLITIYGLNVVAWGGMLFLVRLFRAIWALGSSPTTFLVIGPKSVR